MRNEILKFYLRKEFELKDKWTFLKDQATSQGSRNVCWSHAVATSLNEQMSIALKKRWQGEGLSVRKRCQEEGLSHR